jgi:hypothetical protein
MRASPVHDRERLSWRVRWGNERFQRFVEFASEADAARCFTSLARTHDGVVKGEVHLVVERRIRSRWEVVRGRW